MTRKTAGRLIVQFELTGYAVHIDPDKANLQSGADAMPQTPITRRSFGALSAAAAAAAASASLPQSLAAEATGKMMTRGHPLHRRSPARDRAWHVQFLYRRPG
jgi:hypothetical protein